MKTVSWTMFSSMFQLNGLTISINSHDNWRLININFSPKSLEHSTAYLKGNIHDTISNQIMFSVGYLT